MLKKWIPISIAMTEEMAQRARIMAAIHGKSRSEFVRAIVEDALKQCDQAGDADRPGLGVNDDHAKN